MYIGPNNYIINRDVNETRESQVKIFFLYPEKGISPLPRIETSNCQKMGLL